MYEVGDKVKVQGMSGVYEIMCVGVRPVRLREADTELPCIDATEKDISFWDSSPDLKPGDWVKIKGSTIPKARYMTEVEIDGEKMAIVRTNPGSRPWCEPSADLVPILFCPHCHQEVKE